MVTLLSEVADERALAIYQKNLENNQGGIIEEILLASKPELFIKLKEVTENILELSPKIIMEGGLDDLLQEAPDELLFIANGAIELPPQSIQSLVSDFELHSKAGFITGLFTEYEVPYFVDDIYSDKPTLKTEALTEGIVPVDITLPYGFIARKEVLLPVWGRSLELQGYTFGLKLRRLGYQNYVDTNIKYRYLGGK